MRLLIVDDSVVFRTQIRNALESSMQLTSVATAANGKIAMQKLEQEGFDVMTLDMEMPEMNGIETLKEIKAKNLKVKVVIFSAQTTKGAALALEALSLGAIEIATKPSGGASSMDEALQQIKFQLVPVLTTIQGQLISDAASVYAHKIPNAISSVDLFTNETPPSVKSSRYERVTVETFKPKIVVIGSSTGGPTALEVLFENVKPPISVPILIVQHMPPVFTASLASRLSSLTGIEAEEGKNGEVLKSGRIYIAPGDYHMGLFMSPRGISIKLSQGPKRCNVRPAVDVLFEDVSAIYDHHVGGIVLTGMGEDGMLGCKAIKSKKGGVIIQDKETSVVWGMPGAVHASGAFDKMASLKECGKLLENWVKM